MRETIVRCDRCKLACDAFVRIERYRMVLRNGDVEPARAIFRADDPDILDDVELCHECYDALCRWLSTR